METVGTVESVELIQLHFYLNVCSLCSDPGGKGGLKFDVHCDIIPACWF